MRIVCFCHSLVSDWNNGHAHFLRGVVAELQARGHDVVVYEPVDGWSRRSLIASQGQTPLEEFARRFPHLRSELYDARTLDLRRALGGAELVLVHEWNEPALVAAIGEERRRRRFRLLFHDTHHRAVTAPEQMEAYDLRHYDGVLAYGRSLRDVYLERGWARRVWVWHEAADTRVFRPRQRRADADVVWIGNWGDEERSAELREFLIEPVRRLGLRGSAYGVRYPDEAMRELEKAGLEYRGWLPNYRVPDVFARHRITVHIPRRAYVERLPGIPTIRLFEALACGIPLAVALWRDTEALFQGPGRDYLRARDGSEMLDQLTAAVDEVAREGLRTIGRRHTCAHRVDELLAICRELERTKAAA
jgi:spore maturation protein CgeB